MARTAVIDLRQQIEEVRRQLFGAGEQVDVCR
jgi:hypothetical protein